MLILNSIQQCKTIADYNFFIVRSTKSIPKGFYHVPELSPPKSLFFRVQKWKKQFLWPEKWEEYRSSFIGHMDRGTLSEYLDHLEELLSDGKSVQLVCYCPDASGCHRTIIGDYFSDKGYEVNYG